MENERGVSDLVSFDGCAKSDKTRQHLRIWPLRDYTVLKSHIYYRLSCILSPSALYSAKSKTSKKLCEQNLEFGRCLQKRAPHLMK